MHARSAVGEIIVCTDEYVVRARSAEGFGVVFVSMDENDDLHLFLIASWAAVRAR